MTHLAFLRTCRSSDVLEGLKGDWLNDRPNGRSACGRRAGVDPRKSDLRCQSGEALID